MHENGATRDGKNSCGKLSFVEPTPKSTIHHLILSHFFFVKLALITDVICLLELPALDSHMKLSGACSTNLNYTTYVKLSGGSSRE